MPVTELAILPLTNPLSPTLLTKLRTAKRVLEQESGYTFHYFQQVENPSLIYLLGSWSSVAAHHTFLPSPANQALLESLQDDLKASEMVMYHLDSNIFEVAEGKESFLEAETIRVNRHLVEDGKEEEFVGRFRGVKGLLEKHTEPYHVAAGWKIEKEGDERGEWILFSGCESMDPHVGFPDETNREMGEFLHGFEVNHLKKVKEL